MDKNIIGKPRRYLVSRLSDRISCGIIRFCCKNANFDRTIMVNEVEGLPHTNSIVSPRRHELVYATSF